MLPVRTVGPVLGLWASRHSQLKLKRRKEYDFSQCNSSSGLSQLISNPGYAAVFSNVLSRATMQGIQSIADLGFLGRSQTPAYTATS